MSALMDLRVSGDEARCAEGVTEGNDPFAFRRAFLLERWVSPHERLFVLFRISDLLDKIVYRIVNNVINIYARSRLVVETIGFVSSKLSEDSATPT